MSEGVLERTRHDIGADDRHLVHRYEVRREPQPGDVALCGWVKTTAHSLYLNTPPERLVRCVVCGDLIDGRHA